MGAVGVMEYSGGSPVFGRACVSCLGVFRPGVLGSMF